MFPAERSEAWGIVARRHPSAFLLAAQLLSLLVHPLMDQSVAGRWLFGAVALVVVPLALWVVGRSPLVNWIAWLLAVPAILLTLAGVASGQQDLLVASALLEACLYFYAAGGLIVYMLRDHHVSNDELFAAGACRISVGPNAMLAAMTRLKQAARVLAEGRPFADLGPLDASFAELDVLFA